jgi:RimJ/RimL family protein N-acetyltransferase
MTSLASTRPSDASWPVSLRPLSAAGARCIEHWFDHPEVRHWLGDRSWIHRELRLIADRPGSTFRGKTVLRSYGWIVEDPAGTEVAFIGGDVYDRWVRYLGEGPNGALLSEADPRRAMGLGYVVDPARWRRGYGRAAIATVLRHADVADVEVFYCGIDAANHASRRCALAAGFHLIAPEPDFEGMLYYRRERGGHGSSVPGS